MIKTAILVCEGACNPSRESLEAIVDEDSRKDDKGRMMRGSKVVLLRALTHTPHTFLRRTSTGKRWRCDICGSDRSYG